MKDKDYIIPALSRGLKIVDLILNNERQITTGYLKEKLVGISDPSLNRLLTSLESEGYILRPERGKLYPGPALKNWNRKEIELKNRSSYEQILTEISRVLMLPVAIAVLSRDSLRIAYSIPNGSDFTISRADTFFYWEADHAASVAVLSQLDIEKRNWVYLSSRSKIKSEAIFKEGLKNLQNENYFLDRSHIFPGISRLALPIRLDERPAAIFTKATREYLYEKKKEIADLFSKYKTSFSP